MKLNFIHIFQTKLPILSAFLLVQTFCFAQRTEYGIALGGVSYAGDLYRGYEIANQSLGIQGLYRINFEKDVSFKMALLYGKVSGDDSHPFDPLGEIRNTSFSRSFFEASATFEYHFLDYKNKNSTIKWTPYFFAGFGLTKFINLDESDNFSSIQPVLPFGGGIKHLVGKQFSMAVEFGARKTFFDELDGISDGDVFDKTNTQFGNPNDKDWYHYFNISISYLIYKIPCTYKYIPNKSMY
ncbi:hypothetical protein SAMN04488029_2459 [Reichenbachiella faecimaris]|uniref:DUF6089 domain-containing protein n=1 Tax=Reichenbachiella faecimaris TaxID=692418 RepID=A0A1W2GGC7_REIFA|nr:DUF6089 family protein [Reichenbachiella faecimaris]SMD35336.1 hypothetical protein SAMN04488029_2459 [Reichenbachiella faecimaris]